MRSRFLLMTAMALMIATGGLSCSLTPKDKRAPASVRKPAASCPRLDELPSNLLESTRLMQEFFRDKSCFNAGTAQETLDRLYTQLFQARFQELDKAELKAQTRETIKAMFEAQLTLRQRFWEFLLNREIGPRDPMITSWRNVTRAVRYLQDGIGETAYAPNQRSVPKETQIAFSGTDPQLLVNPDFGTPETFKLMSGDILLMRGFTFNSAAIARIGDVDAQFSHNAFVYWDTETRKFWLVESLIETGLIAEPLEKHMRHLGSRVMVLRHADPRLAHESAGAMFRMARKLKAENRVLPYNFSMDLKKSDSIMCSQVIYLGFYESSVARHGTGAAIHLPMFPSQITVRNREFVDAIGVTVRDHVFHPNDIEFDLNYRVAAEWRDWRFMKDIRIKDMILTKIFQWMEEDNIVFQDDIMVKLAARLAHTLRRFPVTDRIVGKKLPLNMNKRAVAMVTMLQFSAGEIYSGIEKDVDKHFKKTGMPMHPREMQERLEAYKGSIYLGKKRE